MFKKIAYFAAGFVLGGAVGFALTKKLISDKMGAPSEEQESNEPDEETTGIDISEVEVDGEQVVSAKRNEEEFPNYSETSAEAESTEKIFRYEASKPRMTDYSKYGNKRTYMDEYEEEKDYDSVDELETLSPSEGLNNEPEYISPNSYMGEYDHFDKVELTYYEGDDVLAEIDGGCELDVTEDVRGNLPGDYIEHFGEFVPEQIDIRAHRVSTDYEIVRTRGFFYEEEDDEE